jgi:sterol desaturase/sphingolipid hydroxylase (fatty acid hydroxylase superfamily)
MTIEHDKAGYLADFILYPLAIAGLLVLLVVLASGDREMEIAALALLGLVTWTLLEYLLHRFVLHGIQPFQAWHAEHHRRPKALIGTSTLLSAVLIIVLFFLPALIFSDLLRACALTIGLLTGYLLYVITHHALHHWSSVNAITRQLKRSHALHHYRDGPPAWFGVTSPIWDIVFGTCRNMKNGSTHKSAMRSELAYEEEKLAAWDSEGGAPACTSCVSVTRVRTALVDTRN